MVEYFHMGSSDEAYNACADVISEAIEDLLSQKEKVVLAVPGGRNVAPVFQNLRKKNIPWNKVHLFTVDEKLMDYEDEGSNYYILKENLIDPLIAEDKLPSSSLHPFVYNPEEDDDGIKEYEEELKAVGGKFDIVLLSSGEDGHVGALYPNHHSIENESDYFLTINNSPKPPKNRMTSSKKLLQRSQVALLMFIGKDKYEAYKKFNDENVSLKDCPARLAGSIVNSFVFTDYK
ncbi:MAG: 6-phosphogluconolactonase [Nanoarchaeota archaeon]